MTERHGLAVLVPLKPFALAKSRLGSGFDDATRARIAERLARHVLSIASASFPGAVHVVAVASMATFVNECDATLVQESSAAHSLGEVVDAALDELATRGYGRALVLMGDLPDASPSALSALADHAADVVVAESDDGRGTNALVVRLPRAFAMAFAEEGSGLTHESRARAAGLRVARMRDAAFLRDLDRPSDLRDHEASALAAPSRRVRT